MKKARFLLLLFVAVSSSVIAQTGKGRWQVGTQFGDFSYQTQNSRKVFSGNISPSAGYFVAKNLLVGTGLPLSVSAANYQNVPPNDSYKYVGVAYGLSPFVRYYFGPGKLKPYVGAAFSYIWSKNHSTYTNSDGESREQIIKSRSANFAPGVGVAYFISQNVALNAALNYNVQTTTNESSVSLGIGFQLFFGK